MFKKIIKMKKEASYPEKEKDMGVLEMCRKCYAFKYENSWHFERPAHLLEYDPDEKISVKFSQCSSCIEEALAVYDMEYV